MFYPLIRVLSPHPCFIPVPVSVIRIRIRVLSQPVVTSLSMIFFLRTPLSIFVYTVRTLAVRLGGRPYI